MSITEIDFSKLAWTNQGICVKDTVDQGHNPWLSDHRADIAYAEDRCLDCPVFFECQQYAETLASKFGVYAGRFYDEIS